MFKSPLIVPKKSDEPFSIHHYYVPAAGKVKYSILVAPSAYVIINSLIWSFYIGKFQEKLNILIPLLEHDFLERNSWADCCKVIVCDFNRPKNKFGKGLVGTLHPNCRQEVIDALNKSMQIDSNRRQQINNFCNMSPTHPYKRPK